MKFKNIVFLSFFLIGILIIVISVINYTYLKKVHDNIETMTFGNEQEVIETARITFAIIGLNSLLNDLIIQYETKKDFHQTELKIQKIISELEGNFIGWEKATRTELKYDPKNADKNETHEEDIELETYKVIYSQFQKLKNDITRLIAIPNSTDKINFINQFILPLQKNLGQRILDSSLKAQEEFNIESKEIKSGLTTYGWLNLIFFLGASLIMLLISFLLANFVIRNLSIFTASLAKIASGKFDTKIDIKSNNEFGILAKSFNSMSQELANTKLSIESIISTMPNMLIITDKNMNIKRVNDRACIELGYFQEELIDKPLTTILEDKNIETEIQAISEHSILTKKTILKLKNKTIPVIFSSSVMSLTNPPSKLYVHIAQNITDLKKIEDELIVTSRQAGMADVATSVLHNVGNILNSIRTSIAVVEEQIHNSTLSDLEKIVNLIEEHQANLADFFANNPKGKTILKFLNATAKVTKEEEKKIKNEIAVLKKYIDHITDIITTQQKMSSKSGMREVVDIPELIDETISLQQTSPLRNSIKVIRDFKPIKKVTIDKVKLIQAIVNLIKNAYESILEANPDDKILKVIVHPKDDSHFVIQVIDNGVGIIKENLVPIFSFGFTTKKDGHGFGLHSSAISIKEMGGELHVFSEGAGKGATFTLILPYKAEDRKEIVV